MSVHNESRAVIFSPTHGPLATSLLLQLLLLYRPASHQVWRLKHWRACPPRNTLPPLTACVAPIDDTTRQQAVFSNLCKQHLAILHPFLPLAANRLCMTSYV